MIHLTHSTVFAVFILASSAPILSATQVVLCDDFNRADSPSLGPDWEQFNNGGRASIFSNKLLLSVPAADTESRAVAQMDLTDSSSSIIPAGGFQISFDFIPGVDYTTGFHGGYGLHIYLGPKSIVENLNNSFGNNNVGLRFRISGDGKVIMRDETGTVDSTEVAGWIRNTPKTLSLTVNTDSFSMTSGNNSATLAIAGYTVLDNVSFGKWTQEDELFFAIEAFSGQTIGSYVVDDFAITIIP